MTNLTPQFLSTLSWVAEDQRLHRQFEDASGDLSGAAVPWSDEMKLLLELLDKLQAGKVECVEKVEPPLVLPDVYDHLHTVYKAGKLVGYVAFWGCMACYLPLRNLSASADENSWLDEPAWMADIGGSRCDFRIEEIA